MGNLVCSRGECRRKSKLFNDTSTEREDVHEHQKGTHFRDRFRADYMQYEQTINLELVGLDGKTKKRATLNLRPPCSRYLRDNTSPDPRLPLRGWRVRGVRPGTGVRRSVIYTGTVLSSLDTIPYVVEHRHALTT